LGFVPRRLRAGFGFDAAMIKGSGSRKDRLGRAAYVLSAVSNLDAKPFGARIKVDGVGWYEGPASCILLGNVGSLFGGVQIFEDAQPDDGLLDLGVVTAQGVMDMARMVVRTTVGTAHKSPFIRVTKAHSVQVKLDRKVLYELDGGDRRKLKRFQVDVEPGVVTVCAPPTA